MSTPEDSANIKQFSADLISFLDKHVFEASVDPSIPVLFAIADMLQMSSETISTLALLKSACDKTDKRIEQEQKARLN